MKFCMPYRSLLAMAIVLIAGLWLAPPAFAQKSTTAPSTGQVLSPQRESRPGEAPAARGERTPADTLFGIGDERPGIRIGWHFDAAVNAFKIAIERSVPLVLVLSEDWCTYCTWLTDALTCPAINKLAGSAVFAISAPSRDVGAKAIAGSLSIEAYPTISVIMPEARMLLEDARLNGYFPGDVVARHFDDFQRTHDARTRQRWLEELGETKLRSKWESVAVSKATAVATPLSKTPRYPPRCTQ